MLRILPGPEKTTSASLWDVTHWATAWARASTFRKPLRITASCAWSTSLPKNRRLPPRPADATRNTRTTTMAANEERCPQCGSPRLQLILQYSATGATAPDGTLEYLEQRCLQCTDCGHQEPDV